MYESLIVQSPILFKDGDKQINKQTKSDLLG